MLKLRSLSRELVSKKKRRFVDQRRGIDLDLQPLTPPLLGVLFMGTTILQFIYICIYIIKKEDQLGSTRNSDYSDYAAGGNSPDVASSALVVSAGGISALSAVLADARPFCEPECNCFAPGLHHPGCSQAYFDAEDNRQLHDMSADATP